MMRTAADIGGNAQLAVCDCCRVLDGDFRIKFCVWCRFCRAWLCDVCRNSIGRRARAAFIGG